jgi:tetratricopeptide (TPR) repeat protein
MNATRSRFHVAIAAIAAVLAVLAANGPVRADDLKDARTALQAGSYDRALQLFEKAASQGYAAGKAGVGEVWLKRRQYAKAMDAYQLAQKMDAGLPAAYYGQGEVLRREGKCDQALPLLQKATELDKRYPEAQLAYGDCLMQTKQRERAVAVLSAGLKWGPKWRPRFLVALGNAEMARDSLRDAGIYFTQAREESPDDPVTHRALGDFYVKRGTFELAVPEYQTAIKSDSSDLELRFGLGQALFYAERYNEALDVYRDVVTRDPEFAPAELALGDLLYRSGAADRRRYAEAKEPLEKFVQLNPDDPKGWSVLGRTLAQLGERDAAYEAMNKAEKLGDRSKDMYTMRARLNIDRKNWDEALADYQRGHPEAEDQLRIAQLWVFKNEPARAESLYNSIIAADSTSSSAKFAIGELGKQRYRAKDYTTAIPMFRRRIALDPNNDEAYYYMGLSYKELKQYPDALSALRTAARLADSKADRHFWLGILYAQLDSTAGAARAFTRVVELDSAGTSKNSAIAWRQLGYYDLLAKNHSDAIRKLVRASVISPQDVQTWIWLGQAYQNSGDRAKACEAYRKALEIDPNQPDALKGRKTLGC